MSTRCIQNILGVLGFTNAVVYLSTHPWGEVSAWALSSALWIVTFTITINSKEGGAK